MKKRTDPSPFEINIYITPDNRVVIRWIKGSAPDAGTILKIAEQLERQSAKTA